MLIYQPLEELPIAIKPGRAPSHVIPGWMAQQRLSVVRSGEEIRLIDRDHPPRDDTYGWEPAHWEYWADLAERQPLDRLERAIAVFEADLKRIEYGSTGAFHEWSDEKILAYLRQVFARRLALRG
jgi:hypothetical protein